MAKLIKQKFNILILILITLLVLFFSLKDNFKLVIENIFTLNPFWFVLALFLVAIYFLLRSLVMKKLVRHFKDDYSYKDAFSLVMATQFFHAITPFASGGQPYEIYSLNKDGIKLTDATNISIQNFIVYQIALVILGVIAVASNYYFKMFNHLTFLQVLTTGGFIINLLIIVSLFVVTFAKKVNKWVLKLIVSLLAFFKVVKNKERIIKNWTNYLNDFYAGAKILLKDKKQFIWMIVLNFISLIAVYLTPLILLYSMGDYHSFNAFESVITCAYVMLVGNFVPIPGGSGGLEYAFIMFFSTFITGAVLNSIMLLWRFLTYYLGMILGALAFNLK